MGNPQYILAIDQGTTSSRAIIFDHEGKSTAMSQKPFEQYFPQQGWVEHDPSEIWYTQFSVVTEVLAKANLSSSDIAAIGICNQRETTIIWDRKTSQPIYNAIVWQDRRTAHMCDRIKDAGHAEMIRTKTGLIIDAYFSATKIAWILQHIEGAAERARRGELCFGTVDTWLLWKLTGGKVHATDVSNASRTMLFNINTLQWDQELLDLFGIPIEMMPEVRSSSECYAHTSSSLFPSQIPIAGIAGDQQAALFGQMCTQKGMAKTTFGTGCFMMMNTGNTPVTSNHNLLSTVAWKIGNDVNYALEGSVFIGGAIVQWLRDNLGIITSSDQCETKAFSVEDNGGVYLVPALTGLGAPYWDQYARGMIIGITRGTTAAHIIRAALESIDFQVLDVLRAMERDTASPTLEMRVDGGATTNNFLMQFLSDISRISVIKPQHIETSALGVAFLAGLATGYWKDTVELQSIWSEQHTYSAQMDIAEADKRIRKWHKAVERSLSWCDTDEE